MNYKSKLSEYCQQNNLSFPVYTVESPTGPPHLPVFSSGSILIEGREKWSVDNREHRKRKDIEADLAKTALNSLQVSALQVSALQVSASPSINKLDPGTYLVDYDHNGHLQKLISIEADQMHLFEIFAGIAFNPSSLPSTNEWVHTHQATVPTSEMVDHMMTWWAARNLGMLQLMDQVIIVSNDKGMYSLVEILKSNNVKAVYKSSI